MRQYDSLFPSDAVNRQCFEVGCCQYHIHLAALRDTHDLDAQPGRQPRWMLNCFIKLHHEVDIATFGGVIKAGTEEPDDRAFTAYVSHHCLDSINVRLG